MHSMLNIAEIVFVKCY